MDNPTAEDMEVEENVQPRTPVDLDGIIQGIIQKPNETIPTLPLDVLISLLEKMKNDSPLLYSHIAVLFYQHFASSFQGHSILKLLTDRGLVFSVAEELNQRG